jgi:hypothetical protein
MRLDDLVTSEICIGKAGKFIDDNNIVFTDLDKICRLDLHNQNTSVIKNGVNCKYILLNPSKTHIIYVNITSAKDGGGMFEYEGLYIMLLNGKNCSFIRGFSPYTFGIEWIDYYTEYYITHTIKKFSGYE